MFNTEDNPSYNAVCKFIAGIASTAVLLLDENPRDMTEFEVNKEVKLGISWELYIASVHMKNALTDLFGTYADSLIYNNNRTPQPLVHEDGNFEPNIIEAIIFRYASNNINIPEFTIPLGEELHKATKNGAFANKEWQLVAGVGKLLHFQAIGERHPVHARVPKRRAIAVKIDPGELI